MFSVLKQQATSDAFSQQELVEKYVLNYRGGGTVNVGLLGKKLMSVVELLRCVFVYSRLV